MGSLFGGAEDFDSVFEVEQQRYVPPDVGGGDLAECFEQLWGCADEGVVEVASAQQRTGDLAVVVELVVVACD